ncbi:MAG: hypothetical protein LBS29_05155 [Endomicrobium sp.]|jgi:hypothetical protein|nr:hypothetical protein [Endomicrobium sp.]
MIQIEGICYMYSRRQDLILNYVKKQKTASRNDIQAYISKSIPTKNSKVI